MFDFYKFKGIGSRSYSMRYALCSMPILPVTRNSQAVTRNS